MENKARIEEKLKDIERYKANTHSLQAVVFKYVRRKGENTDFMDIEFEKLMSVDNNRGGNGVGNSKMLRCRDAFDGEYKRFHSALKDIFRIFGISTFIDEWKKDGEYVFWDNEVNIVCDLVYRYNKSAEWKLLKKVDNRNFDGFIKIYEKNLNLNILLEVIQTVNSLKEMYIIRHFEDEPQKVDSFINPLLINTQYYKLQWIYNMNRILSFTPNLTMDEAEKSVGGVLLKDYQEHLDELTKTILLIVNVANDSWNEVKEMRYQQMAKAMDNDMDNALGFVLEELISTIKEKDKEAGEAFEKILGEDEYSEERVGDKRSRAFDECVEQQIRKAFEELGESYQRRIYDFIKTIVP